MLRRIKVLGVVLITGLLVSCELESAVERRDRRLAEEKQQSNIREASLKAKNREGVEQQNYQWRQDIAEDETTILWCTFSFNNPNSPLITIPIKGKLTSGGKRPFPTHEYNGLDGGVTDENPGEDGMYGNSAVYRYGFGTSGSGEYYEFSDLDYLCTTVPTVFQKEKTEIILESDRSLFEATKSARDAITTGDEAKAKQILDRAIGGN